MATSRYKYKSRKKTEPKTEIDESNPAEQSLDNENQTSGEKTTGSFIFTGDSEGKLTQWRSDNLECIKEYGEIAKGTIWTMDISYDKKFIFLGDDSGHMYQYDIADQSLSKRYYRAHEFALYVICIAKGPKYSDNLFTVGKKGYMKQWSIKDKKNIKKYGKIHDYAVTSMTSSSDGAYIYTAGQKGYMKQFSVERQEMTKVFKRFHDSAIYAIILLKDDKTLLTTDEMGKM